jgi:hypothetical protein
MLHKHTWFSKPNKDKRKTKWNCPGFKFKHRQVNDSSQSNQEIEHLVSHICVSYLSFLRSDRWLDITLFMNQRILTKYGENLYRYSSLICENWTLWFSKMEQCHNFSSEPQMCFIYPFWSYRWAIHYGGFKSSIWVHILVIWNTFFVPWVKFNQIVRETRA